MSSERIYASQTMEHIHHSSLHLLSYSLHNKHLIATCTETMLWYKLNHLGQYFTHICELWKNICPQSRTMRYLDYSSQAGKNSCPGPFPTLGHSSYTNQSAPWRECITLRNVYLLHIIFIIPMTVNDVSLSVSFRGVSGLSSWREKGEELFLRKQVAFSYVKTL